MARSTEDLLNNTNYGSFENYNKSSVRKCEDYGSENNDVENELLSNYCSNQMKPQIYVENGKIL